MPKVIPPKTHTNTITDSKPRCICSIISAIDAVAVCAAGPVLQLLRPTRYQR